MHALMTAAIIYYPELPSTGLRQSMHNPIRLLDIDDIFWSPGFIGDELIPKISHYLIANAIKGIHQVGIDHIFDGSDLFPQMLRI
jgi:hypothetical protein